MVDGLVGYSWSTSCELCAHNLLLAAVRTVIWADLIFIRCILCTRWKYSCFFSASFHRDYTEVTVRCALRATVRNSKINNRSKMQDGGGVIGMSGLYLQKRAWLAHQGLHLDKSISLAPHHILAFSIYRVASLSLKFSVHDSVHSYSIKCCRFTTLCKKKTEAVQF